MEFLRSLDIVMFRFVNNGLGHPWLDPLMLFLSSEITWIVVAVFGLMVSIVRRSKQKIVFCILLGLCAGASDLFSLRVMKPFTDRLRPCHQLEEVRLVADGCGGKHSFPSNHAANGAAVLTAAVLFTGSLRLLWFAIPVFLIGFSRIYLGVHFPFDVLTGFFVGTLVGVIFVLFVRRLFSSHLPNFKLKI